MPSARPWRSIAPAGATGQSRALPHAGSNRGRRARSGSGRAAEGQAIGQDDPPRPSAAAAASARGGRRRPCAGELQAPLISSRAWVAVVVVSRRGACRCRRGRRRRRGAASRHVADDRGVDGPPRLRSRDARPADPRLELAADGEHGVADLLGIEPLDVRFQSSRFSGSIRRADGQSRRRPLRRLPVGRRGQDQPVHRLQLPAPRDELGRQPVEQLGMAGRLAQPAEVARQWRPGRGRNGTARSG